MICPWTHTFLLAAKLNAHKMQVNTQCEIITSIYMHLEISYKCMHAIARVNETIGLDKAVHMTAFHRFLKLLSTSD